jgi:uroporphyrinogen III methyltransferase / synthase
MTISILVSPSEAQTDFARELVNRGGRVIRWPALNINAPPDYSALDDAIENLFGYDWLIVKSEAAAEYFLRRFERHHQIHELDELKTLAIGEQAQPALSRLQIHVDAMAERSTEAFAALESYAGNVTGLNLLVPSANMNRETFERQLEEAGARVDSATAYRTCSNSDDLAKLKALLAGGGADCVAFTGASAVNEFASLFDTDDLRWLLPDVDVACLDQSTRSAANSFGLIQFLFPSEPSVQALAHLITAQIR